jgi:hypothetical protein
VEHSKNGPEHVPAMFRAMFRLKPLKIKAFPLTGTLEHLFSILYKNREIRGFRENINSLNRLCACIYARDVPDVPPLKGGAFLKESYIENYLVRKVKENNGLCLKFVSPGNPGVPDRIVITPDGRTIYVELKTEVGRLAKIQKWQRSELEKRGADVRVLFGMDAVKEFLREVFD